MFKLKTKNTILVIFFYFLLIYGYKNYVYPLFGYSGFEYTINILRFCESLILFLITLTFINYKNISKFIYAVNITIFVFMTIPNYILYIFMKTDRIIIYSYLLLHITIIFFSKIKINIKSYFLYKTQGDKVLLLLSFALLIPFFITYGFNLNFNVLLLKDIYEVREVSSKNSNVFTGYFYSWLSNVVLPLIIIYGYINKKKILIMLGIIFMLYLFLVAAHKSVFFGLLILLYLNMFSGYYKKIFGLLVLVIIVILSGFIVDIIYGNIIISSMFLRRVFFLPALLNQYYFDFFANNHLYLSHSIFKHFISYPYSILPANLIGLQYFNSIKMSANNGIISDGFMNFGYMGIMLNIVIVAIIFSFFKAIKINEILFPIVVLFIFALDSSALFTVMLTHGLLIFIMLLMYFNKKLNLVNKKIYKVIE